MKSEWKVSSNYIGATKKFIVYRLLDKDATDHSGNREYAPGMDYTEDRGIALGIAYELNELDRRLV